MMHVRDVSCIEMIHTTKRRSCSYRIRDMRETHVTMMHRYMHDARMTYEQIAFIIVAHIALRVIDCVIIARMRRA
jgi:hypothetical protein